MISASLAKFSCIAVGGAAGAVLRYLVSGWVYRLTGAGFPWGTMAVNVLGSLVIGLLSAAFASANVSESLRALLLVGLLGAFTTFSTFSLETLELLNGRQWLFAAANVVVSCLLGLAAVWAGLLAGRALGR